MSQGSTPPPDGPGFDLRLPAAACCAWVAALVAGADTGWFLGLAAAGGVVLFVVRVGWRATLACWWLAAVVIGLSVLLHRDAVTGTPLAALAADRASASGEVVIGSDPRPGSGRFGPQVLVDAQLREVRARGAVYRLHAPVLVIGGADWADVRQGQRVRVAGRLTPASGADTAALLSVRGPPRVVSGPGLAHRAAERVRQGIRDAVAGRSRSVRGLVPALVDGDEAGLSDDLRADFRTSGLTHLVAVSGTNLTLVVGALLMLTRRLGVRGRGQVVVGAVGVGCFVLLAGPEPSVLRAAAMGTVGLIGLGSNGRQRGTRSWGVAVLVLLALDPWLATSAGFVLSALATGGILVLAPGWRDALAGWMPRVLAEALAVPLAAQVACTPVVAAISGQVSLVAVLANLLVAPLVGPATVFGLVGGLVAVVGTSVGGWVALPGAWCAGAIVWVARHSSGLPLPAIGWGTGAGALVVLTLCCVGFVLVAQALLRSRGSTLLLSGALCLVMLVPLPTPGWPPTGWVLVMCDVGQGDGLVLSAGPGTAVVVDTGPEPDDMRPCLRRLGVHRVPLVVLTHFHADHVGGIAGVLRSVEVGTIVVSPYPDPDGGAQLVARAAEHAHVPVRAAVVGETGHLGPLTWQVLAPSEPAPPDSDSPPNDESVVLLVRSHGLRMLLMGDEETGSQRRLAAADPGLRADVLKVAHHGSAKQDADLVTSLGARLALISDGQGNDYGHPAPTTLRLLERAGLTVERTDQRGDIAVIVSDSRLLVRSRGHPKPAP